MIEERIVASTEELIYSVREDYKNWKTNTFPWFRGEPTPKYPEDSLLPKLFRKNESGRIIQPLQETNLLHHFRMKAPSLGISNAPPNDRIDEWLFLAQHVKLPTRLLDWTEGLFIALYFALKYDSPVIWMLDPIALNRLSSSKEIKDNEFHLTWLRKDNIPAKEKELLDLGLLIENDCEKREGKIIENFVEKRERHETPNIGSINIRGAWGEDKHGSDLPVAIHPSNIHPRMIVQKSCFTVQGKKKDSMANLVDDRVLKKYVIKNDAVEQFRKDIKLFGFSETSVFPDLDGLSVELAEKFL